MRRATSIAALVLAVATPARAGFYPLECDEDGVCSRREALFETAPTLSAIVELDADDATVEAVIIVGARLEVRRMTAAPYTRMQDPIALAGGEPLSLLAEDLDGDGVDDVALGYEGKVVIHAYDTSPIATSGTTVDLPPGFRPLQMRAGDFDGDDDPDIVLCSTICLVAWGGGGSFDVRAMELDGASPSDAVQILIEPFARFQMYTEEDLDHGGLVLVEHQGRRLRWVVASAAVPRTFEQYGGDFETGLEPSDIAVREFNDFFGGHTVVVANHGERSISLFANFAGIAVWEIEGSPVVVQQAPFAVAFDDDRVAIFSTSNLTEPLILPSTLLFSSVDPFLFEDELTAADPERLPYATDRLYVHYDCGLTSAEIEDLIDAIDVELVLPQEVIGHMPQICTLVIGTKPSRVGLLGRRLVAALAPDWSIEYSLDTFVGAGGRDPSCRDEWRDEQWYLERFTADGVAHLAGPHPVELAVIDGCLDAAKSADLEYGHFVLPSWDFTDDGRWVKVVRGPDTEFYWQNPTGSCVTADDPRHIEALTEIVAAPSCNDSGIAGMADLPQVDVGSYRALRPDLRGRSSSVAMGLLQAVADDVDVVLLALGTPHYSELLARTVEYASDHGIVVVAASGNRANFSVDYPARLPGAVAVGAIDRRDELAYFQSYGEQIDVVAGGVGVIDATGFDNEGTSYAAAMVAAQAALLRTHFPGRTLETGAQIRAAILGTAVPLPPKCRVPSPDPPLGGDPDCEVPDERWGFGTIDVTASLVRVQDCFAGVPEACADPPPGRPAAKVSVALRDALRGILSGKDSLIFVDGGGFAGAHVP